MNRRELDSIDKLFRDYREYRDYHELEPRSMSVPGFA